MKPQPLSAIYASLLSFKMKYSIVLILCFYCFGCSPSEKHMSRPYLGSAFFGIASDTIDVSRLAIDSGLKSDNLYTDDLVKANALVENAIYTHFESKGIVSWDKFLIKSNLSDVNKVVIYDTLYPIRFPGVSAWIARYSLLSEFTTEVQDTKLTALVVQTQNGLKVANESILPTNLYIDSVKQRKLYAHSRSNKLDSELLRFEFYVK